MGNADSTPCANSYNGNKCKNTAKMQITKEMFMSDGKGGGKGEYINLYYCSKCFNKRGVHDGELAIMMSKCTPKV